MHFPRILSRLLLVCLLQFLTLYEPSVIHMQVVLMGNCNATLCQYHTVMIVPVTSLL